VLAPLVGKTDSSIKNYYYFVELIKGSKLDPEDNIVSFDVTQIFTNIPLEEAI